MVICAIDDKEFNTEKEMLLYVRKVHKLCKEDYYCKYFVRNDLYSGEPIKFKSTEQYLNSYYNSRENLINHLTADTWDDKARKMHIANIFKQRIAQKGYKKQLSQVELRSSIMPSIVLLEKLNVNYTNLTQYLGLINKFNYLDIDLSQKMGNLIVQIDTREQFPLEFDCQTIINKLNYGDYCASAEFFDDIFIERKSLNDFIGTLSGGHERFIEEVNRANEFNSYIIMAVECDIRLALGFNKLAQFNKIKATPDFIFSRLRDLMQKFDNFQPVFFSGRTEMSQKVQKILKIGKKIVKYDMQYLLDKKFL